MVQVQIVHGDVLCCCGAAGLALGCPVADDDIVGALGSRGLLACADGIHALILVIQNHDAFQALDALVVVDGAAALDGADLAFVVAVLAGFAACVDARQPGEQPQPAEDRQP